MELIGAMRAEATSAPLHDLQASRGLNARREDILKPAEAGSSGSKVPTDDELAGGIELQDLQVKIAAEEAKRRNEIQVRN